MEPVQRFPQRDPSLPHQVVLYFAGGHVAVSCNCQRHLNNTAVAHHPFGLAEDYEATRALYNDPGRHTGPTPFTEDFWLKPALAAR